MHRPPNPFARTVTAAILSTAICFAFPSPASAQEGKWGARIALGGSFAADRSTPLDDGTEIGIGSGTVLILEAQRFMTCRVELALTGIVTLRMSMKVGTGSAALAAGSLAPSGLQLSVRYRLGGCAKGHFYAGPLVGGFSGDRSEAVVIGGQPVTFQLRSSWGVGALGGYRYRLKDDRVSIDVNASWMQIRIPVESKGRFTWNPLIISAGAFWRF